MHRWFIFVIAAAVAAAVYMLNPSTEGILAGVAAIILCVGAAFLLDLLNNKVQIARVLPPLLGIFIAVAAVGLASPIFSGFSPYVIWIVAGFFVSLGGYGFYLYEREVGFARGGSVSKLDKKGDSSEIPPKVLDTSIIIDGRIIDIAASGFIEGDMIVPNFVLREIQLISDSPDPIKRNRGRRGLDMLNQLQKRPELEVKINYKDYPDTREVDAKLVRLARELNGKLITNDFNLNKVAELQEVSVLNINNLANALKPVVLPGEEMDIQVVKEGKDENQGIGYLDDGTMVVIENGGKLMGKKVKVGVTSVLQTNAGKMIFTKVAGKN